MADKYYCPHCRADLNPGTKIILRVVHGDRSGLLLFSPQVGNYACVLPERFQLEPGETVAFSCPVCHASLASPSDERLGEILLSREGEELARVNFSRVFGEQATFVIAGGRVESYGDDASSFGSVNFFGAGRADDGA